MGLTVLKVEVGNPAKPEITEKVEFLIDSWAIYSVVPSSILKKLGIKPLTEEEFRLANGEKIIRKKGIALFKYGDRIGGADVIFGEEDDTTLLGAFTLEALGLILDPLKRQLKTLPMIQYPDGKYKVSVRAYDIKENQNTKTEDILIDNFKPYVKDVNISGRGIPYSGQWKLKSDGTLVLKKSGGSLRPGKIEVKVVFSETMDTAIIPQVYYDPQGEGKGAGLQTINFVRWETTNHENDTFVGRGVIPNNKEQFEGKAVFIVKNAKDLADNDIDGEPETIATYTVNPDGTRQWNNHLPQIDKHHDFLIVFGEETLAVAVRGYPLSEENPHGIVLWAVNSQWRQEFSSSVFSPGEITNGTQYLWVNCKNVSITSTTVMRIKLSQAEYKGGYGHTVFHLINFGINIVGYDENDEVYWSYLPDDPYGILPYYGWNTVKGGTPFEQKESTVYFPVFDLVKMPVYGNKDPTKITSWDISIYGVVESLGTIYSKWEISGVDLDIKQNSQPNNQIDHLNETIMTLSDIRSTIKVRIPANTFSRPVNIEIKKPSFYPANKKASMKATNIGIEINSAEQLPSGKKVEIITEFSPESGFNLFKDDLVIARYDEIENDWKILPTQSSPTENKIVAVTEHLSVFQVFELKAAEDFKELIVYPNPYKSYEHSNGGITFKNPTSDANIKIYNIAGEKVFEDNKNDDTNKYFWPIKNIHGEKVASGVYLYFIRSSNGQKAKGKLAIIK